jgi:hypothetical protein
MDIGRKTLLALGASVAILAFGAPVFASGSQPGSITAGPPIENGSGSSGTCNFFVSTIKVTSTSPATFPISGLTLAITVDDTGMSGTWYFPDPKQVANNPQSLPKIEITQAGTPVSGDTSVVPTSVTQPIPSVTMGGSATASYTYVLSTPLPAGSYQVSLVPNNAGNVFHMYNSATEAGQGVNTAPVCDGQPVPVGQLPEVPFAAGLPLLGLGLGSVVWYRRHHRRGLPTA